MKGVPLQQYLAQQQRARGRGRGRRVPVSPGSCYNCGQAGHHFRQCQFNRPPGQATEGPKRQVPNQICPRYRRGLHWSSECRSQTDIDGNSLTNSGNLKRGPPRAPKKIYGAFSNQDSQESKESVPLPEPLQEVQDWTSPLLDMWS